MAFTKKMQKAINEQLGYELGSSYLYLAMSAHFSHKNLAGAAHWFRIQAQEELIHAMKLYDFILAREGEVSLQAVAAPGGNWKTSLVLFEEALKHERMVSQRFNDLAELAIKEKDHASANLLQWFVTEQVEEESQLVELIHKLKLIGDSGSGLFMLDQELGKRVLTTAAA
ncbi:MAG: ferritin [Deltaproteobacteria bacterium]|nr:ferritin [Deltaproteobacteria bacterium]